MTYDKRLRRWELALLWALCLTLCLSLRTQADAGALAARLVRLHVVAVSDSEVEQGVKLRVRDAVLEYLEPRLIEAADAASALEIIRAELPGIKNAALAASSGREVTVTLGMERYPTRHYEGFSLPTGEYESLRVVLGAGEGHNWWCVVFPPLCMSAAETREAVSGMTGSLPILTDDSDVQIQFRFRLVELWAELMELLGRG